MTDPKETLLYPYQNKSLEDMEGETWKDIPGFEGTYQASNQGRIRSLDRIIPHPRLKQQFIKGRILSQSTANWHNLKTGDAMTDLRVSLSVEGHQYDFNTRRLVYLTFVDRHIDFEKDGLYVINIDGIGYNNRPENLRLVTKSMKQHRIFDRNRADGNYLKTADRSTWTKPYGGVLNRKPIAQYDLQGQLLSIFESVTAAAKNTGIDEKSIIQVAKGLYKQWNGFKFSYYMGAEMK